MSADGRSHQYHQQINQVACSIARRNWTYSSDDANTFALEPHFGCCTANLHQGWPKLVRALWYRRGSRLITGLHAPNRLRTEIDDIPVQILVETDYPFGEKLVYRIEVGAPVRFELWLRIPGWCNQTQRSKQISAILPTMMSGFARFERVWSSGDQITMELPQKVKVVNRPSGGIGFELGPWIMAFPPGEIWDRIPGSTGFGDYEVRARYSWNYGLSPFDPEKTQRLVGPRSSPPFQIGWISRLPVAPVMIEVTARLLQRLGCGGRVGRIGSRRSALLCTRTETFPRSLRVYPNPDRRIPSDFRLVQPPGVTNNSFSDCQKSEALVAGAQRRFSGFSRGGRGFRF